MSNITVREFESGDAAAWDAYVQAHPSATFFHLCRWQDVVRDALGHRSYYLVAERDAAIVGVLPLGQVKSAMFGNALISVPFCVYGGAIGDDETVVKKLESEALALGTRLGVDYVELRNVNQCGDASNDDACLYVTFKKELDLDPEANLKAVPRKQRAMIRKGIKAGLEAEVDADVDRFFHMYSLSVRNLGTPVLPKRWFETIKSHFGEAVDVLTITHDGNAVSSVLSYYFRDQVLPYYGGGGPLARSLKGNDFMYYALMNHAVARGARVFDYGRSKKGSGSYSFKKNWGFEPVDLAYDFQLVNATDPPALNPNNPKYQLAISVWQKLPLPVTQMLGPHIAKYLA